MEYKNTRERAREKSWIRQEVTRWRKRARRLTYRAAVKGTRPGGSEKNWHAVTRLHTLCRARRVENPGVEKRKYSALSTHPNYALNRRRQHVQAVFFSLMCCLEELITYNYTAAAHVYIHIYVDVLFLMTDCKRRGDGKVTTTARVTDCTQ